MTERKIDLFKSILTILIIFIVIPASSSAQNSATAIGKFRLQLNNGTYIEGKKGVMSSVEFTGVSYESGDVNFPFHEIKSIERKNGNQAREGGQIGATIGTVGVIGVIIYNNCDSDKQFDFEKVIYSSFRILGVTTITGAVIGLLVPKWEKVPIPNVSAGISQNGNVGVSLTLKF
jgi:hypothetical protein